MRVEEAKKLFRNRDPTNSFFLARIFNAITTACKKGRSLVVVSGEYSEEIVPELISLGYIVRDITTDEACKDTVYLEITGWSK